MKQQVRWLVIKTEQKVFGQSLIGAVFIVSLLQLLVALFLVSALYPFHLHIVCTYQVVKKQGRDEPQSNYITFAFLVSFFFLLFTSPIFFLFFPWVCTAVYAVLSFSSFRYLYLYLFVVRARIEPIRIFVLHFLHFDSLSFTYALHCTVYIIHPKHYI